MKRSIRRAALLNYPDESCSRDYLAQVKSEGYSELAIGLLPEMKQFTGQGYSWEQFRQVAEWAEELGLSLALFTAYQKYREDFVQAHPERGMAYVGDVDMRDSDGLIARNWVCPFQPENKAEYLALLKRAIKFSPVREIHLNDEASIGLSRGSVGCYCDFCVSEYERISGSPPPRKVDWESEEWWRWIQYRLEAWTEVHAYFRAEIKVERPDILVGIQHSTYSVFYKDSPWVRGIDLGRDAEALDMIGTDPYHHAEYMWWHYRPMRRMLTEATRALGGATLDREMNIYPQAWVAPLRCIEVIYPDGFLVNSVPFALGADTITPYSYELMKILPGFFDGFQEAMKLTPYFEKTRPYSYATVVKPIQTEIYGYPEGNYGEEVFTQWPDEMNQVGFPWRWVYDNRLEVGMDGMSGPVILPGAHCLTRGQRELLKTYAEGGNGVLWVGRTPAVDWPGEGHCPPPGEETASVVEVTPVRADHPVLEGVELPILLNSAASDPGIEGETIGEVDGRPALVVRETGEGREIWVAGVPTFNYVRPGGHGGVKMPTGGVTLLRNILLWLGGEEPMARLWPYPPENDYGTLRPWDRRNVPTMELFPMLGEGCLVGLLVNYLGLAYRTNMVLQVPEGTEPKSLKDIYTGEELLPAADVTGRKVSLPVDMPNDQTHLAVELTWE